MSSKIQLEKPDLYEPLTDSSPEVPITYEEALDLAGANNRYQIRLAFLVALGMIIAGLQVMSFPFIFESPNVQCMSNNGQWVDCTPNQDTCQFPMRIQPGSHNTVISAFNLFCGGDQYKILVETTYMIASALGVVSIAPIADKYGKRKGLLISYIITCLSLFGCSFASHWAIFVIFIILSGLGRAPFIYYGYQVLVEVSNEKFRAIGVLVMGVSFACGAAVAGALNDLVDSNYQYFYLYCIALPSLLGLPLVYWWADESPLSYFPVQQYEKAKEELGRIAKINKKTLPNIRFIEEYNSSNSSLSNANTQDTETRTARDYTYLDLFRYKSLRKATLGGAYIAFVTYFVFYGQMLAVDVLSDNPIVISVVTSIVEAIACAASAKLLTKFTRRGLLVSSFAVTAGAFSVFGFISLFNKCGLDGTSCSQFNIWLGYVELALGRFWVATLMCTTFVYANELFPTVIRSRGSGLMNFCGRVGSIIPSSIIYVCKEAGFSPAIIFGLLAVPAIYVSWIMKETKGKPLMNYIEEEKEGKDASSQVCTDDENGLM